MINTDNSGSMILEGAISVFSRALKDNHQIHFLNLYNGVKVECQGSVMAVEDEAVVCKVTLEQILAIKEEKNAYVVRDEYFPENLRADIAGFDLSNLTVTLRDFIYMHNLHANLRKYQRVYPNRYTKVSLAQNGSAVQGNLYDISEGGLGVVSADDGEFRDGEQVNAKFELGLSDCENGSCEKVDVDIDLKLVTSLKYKGAMRYCCQVMNKQNAHQNIVKFTDKRVKETLEELKEQLKTYQ